MANIKITSLPYTTTPLSGEEIVPVVQGGADAQATVNNILSPMNMTFQNIAAIHNTWISISIQNITCLSYANPGDLRGIPMLFVRTTGQPTVHTGWIRSGDRLLPNGSTDATNGGYWELRVERVTPEMFGAKGDNSTDDYSAIWAACVYALVFDFLPGWGCKVRICNLSSNAFTWTVVGNTGWTLHGTSMTIAQNICREFTVTFYDFQTAVLQSIGQYAYTP